MSFVIVIGNENSLMQEYKSHMGKKARMKLSFGVMVCNKAQPAAEEDTGVDTIKEHTRDVLLIAGCCC